MATTDHRHPVTGHRPTCGPECPYRRLYEGAQLSLADMAARQAEALTRVARVRHGIVQALRHADPDRFASIERELGRRLSDTDDDIVLRVLDAWTARPVEPRPAAGGGPVAMAALRAALVEAGLPLPPGDDPARWAETIRAHRTRTTPQPAPTSGPDQGAQTLGDLFADDDGLPAAGTAAPTIAPTTTPTPAAAVTPAPPGAAADMTLGDLFADDDATGPDTVFDDDGFLGDVFDDDGLSAVEPFGDSPIDGLHAAADLLDEGFGDLSDVFGPAGDLPPATPAPPPGGGGTDTPPPARAPAPPLRPTLPGATKKRTGGKAAKVAAIRPDLDGGGELAEPAAALTADKTDALLAAVSVNRPVFLDDLRSVVTDADTLEAWERTMRADATAPVRFLPAKTRHRTLGALVVPRDYLKDLAGGRGWWPECVERYRGNRLYELGVLLRRVGSTVVSYRLGDHTVVLRCNDARGLTGMVVVLDPDVGAGTPAHAEVVAAIDELLRERLTLIAVLGVVDTVIAPLDNLLRDEADGRRWEPSMPVVLGRSWRWGEAGTADVVLGG